MAKVAAITKCDDKAVADKNGDHRMVVILIEPDDTRFGDLDDAQAILNTAHVALAGQMAIESDAKEGAKRKAEIDARAQLAITID